MSSVDWKSGYLSLSPGVSLAILEQPYAYRIDTDDLFELNDEAFTFLAGCDGTRRGDSAAHDDEFVAYCISEEILDVLLGPSLCPVKTVRSPLPSLRFLELQITSRCNLACLHCYQPAASPVDLAPEAAISVVDQFEQMGGLKLMISGGEPVLYPRIYELLDQIAGRSLRRVLITNGSLIDHRSADRLRVHEVQVSLDGWEHGHEAVRGKGSFARVMRGIESVRAAGIDVSIATMIHRENTDEFDRLAAFVEEIGALSWGIDVPCVSGRFAQNDGLWIMPQTAAPLMKYAFGGGTHSTSGFACGHHLMTVLPSGKGAKCGFFADQPVGDAVASLLECWRSIPIIRADELACRPCPHLDECGGGCRFRAPDHRAPDPVMCAVFGVTGNRGGT